VVQVSSARIRTSMQERTLAMVISAGALVIEWRRSTPEKGMR
jgi:hypothetical protein